ncbi:407_t:CDS:2, partial [Racocetra persica]
MLQLKSLNSDSSSDKASLPKSGKEKRKKYYCHGSQNKFMNKKQKKEVLKKLSGYDVNNDDSSDSSSVLSRRSTK